MFETQLLQSFIQVVDTGSITRAASRLNLTQSAVSAQIRKLEEQANCTVLERTTRSQRLTAEGEVLLSYAREILALQEQALVRIGSSKNLAGSVRVGCTEGVVPNWLFPIISSFLKDHPDIQVQIKLGITTDLIQSARQHDLDFVVGPICERVDGADRLWSEPMFWAYAKNMEPDWEQTLPLAFFPEPCPYRKAAISALEKSGLEWRIACTSTSGAGVQAAARAGLALTPLTRSGLATGIAALPEKAILPDLPDAHFAIIQPQSSRTRPTRELIDFIKNAANKTAFG